MQNDTVLGDLAVRAAAITSYTPAGISVQDRQKAIEAAQLRFNAGVAKLEANRKELKADAAIIISNLAGILGGS